MGFYRAGRMGEKMPTSKEQVCKEPKEQGTEGTILGQGPE